MSSVPTASAFVSIGANGAKIIPPSRTHTRLATLQFPKPLLVSSRFFVSRNPNRLFNQEIQSWNASGSFHSVCSLPRLKVSSDDAQFSSIPEDKQVQQQKQQQPNFAEFITSERVKVVAMLALALALCNVDRVVMSVAIVPLSLANGWSRSFSGIVQVGVKCLKNCLWENFVWVAANLLFNWHLWAVSLSVGVSGFAYSWRGVSG